MSQDTRRDKRAKVVSLNVRYKSATVDEFIENHSHDVSKGGIFVKTPTPFPPGTLLKFEIRLSGDKAVIAGVGRVVWKRDPGTASAERPAGMGVKFIKIDESSRLLIDRLVNQKGPEAGIAYSSEEVTQTAAPVIGGLGSPTPRGIQAPSGPPGASPSAPPRPQIQPYSRKHTSMGIGPPGGSAPPAAPPAASASPAADEPPTIAKAGSTPPAAAAPIPQPAKTDRMFPDTGPESDSEAPKERTVMKQAAELLEEALREAGGSMDEVGTNPLFDGVKGSASRPPAEAPHPADEEKTSGGTVIMAARPQSQPPPPAEPARARAPSYPPPQAAVPAAPVSEPPTSQRPASIRPPILERQTQRSSNMGLYVALGLVLVVGGGGVAAWQIGLFGGGGETVPTSTVSAKPTVTPPASTSAAPVASGPAVEDAAVAATSGDASAAVVTAGAGDAASDAKPATKPTATTTATAIPTATTTATTTATATATATTTATATATATTTTTATATATATATTTATATDTPEPKPKPKPKPKPTASESDNPY